MTTLYDSIVAVRALFDAGGEVLEAIFVVTWFMWVLIIERFWYLRWGYRRDRRAALDTWSARADKSSWAAAQIKSRLVSVMRQKLFHSLPMIRALVAVCPLLGLLGTVSGMIEVFDVMAIAGNSNPRAMAAGVSAATIPTMAGMVAALSGLYFPFRFVRDADALRQRFVDQLKAN